MADMATDEQQNDDGQGTAEGTAAADTVDSTDEQQNDDGQGTAEGTAAADEVDDKSDDDKSDEGEDESEDDEVDEDDDRLDAKTRRQIKAKNRENRVLRDRARTAETSVLKYEVAEKTGLPLSAARRLQGNTEEELAADATEMIELFHLRGRITPPNLPDDGRKVEQPGPTRGDDLTAIGSRIYSRS